MRTSSKKFDQLICFGKSATFREFFHQRGGLQHIGLRCGMNPPKNRTPIRVGFQHLANQRQRDPVVQIRQFCNRHAQNLRNLLET